MAEREEWNNKLSNLMQDDLRTPTLKELRDDLMSLSKEEATRVSNQLQLPLVFDCLDISNAEQIDLACEVLTLCLSSLNLGESTNRYKTALEQALLHPHASVKQMALTEIERSLQDHNILNGVCNEQNLLKNVINCIGDDDLGVANKACDIMVAIGSCESGRNVLTSGEIYASLEGLMRRSEVVRLRVYEAVIRISRESENSFHKLQAVGLIPKILSELNNNDVLLKLNIIEILSQLAQCPHGYRFLDENGFLNRIYALIGEDEVTTQLCQPGILRFFGRLGHNKPRELLARYPMFFDLLFSSVEGSDLTVIGISLDTIGFIGQTPEGKIALDSTGLKMEGTIKTIARLLGSLPSEFKVRALNCIENLLRDLRYDVVSITEKWFRLLGTDPMELISKYAKNPFSELRMGGFGILNAIAGQDWGQQAIKNCAGLMEFLLDRNVESIKECKLAKYEVVKLLSNSQVFDNKIVQRMQEFVQQGPFYVQAITEVAVEGN